MSWKRTSYIVVLSRWRYKMCCVSWFKDGFSQSPLGKIWPKIMHVPNWWEWILAKVNWKSSHTQKEVMDGKTCTLKNERSKECLKTSRIRLWIFHSNFSTKQRNYFGTFKAFWESPEFHRPLVIDELNSRLCNLLDIFECMVGHDSSMTSH